MPLRDKRAFMATEGVTHTIGIPVLDVEQPDPTTPAPPVGIEPATTREDLLLLHLIHGSLAQIHGELVMIHAAVSTPPPQSAAWPPLWAIWTVILLLVAILVRG